MSVDITPSRVGRPGPDPARYVEHTNSLGVYTLSLHFSASHYLSLQLPRTIMRRTTGFKVSEYNPCVLIRAGNPVYAGGFAAFVANLVLAGYIVAACLEEDTTPVTPKAESKKTL